MPGKLFACACWTLSIVLCANLQAQEPDAKPAGEQAAKHTSSWMKLKLGYSQGILAGITAADFNAVAENAEAMQGLTAIETFGRGRMPGYATQLEIFKDANAELIKHAKKDNLDGAALAFTQLTLSCVHCHKRLRESTQESGK